MGCRPPPEAALPLSPASHFPLAAAPPPRRMALLHITPHSPPPAAPPAPPPRPCDRTATSRCRTTSLWIARGWSPGRTQASALPPGKTLVFASCSSFFLSFFFSSFLVARPARVASPRPVLPALALPALALPALALPARFPRLLGCALRSALFLPALFCGPLGPGPQRLRGVRRTQRANALPISWPIQQLNEGRKAESVKARVSAHGAECSIEHEDCAEPIEL